MQKSTFITCCFFLALFFSSCTNNSPEDPNVVIIEIPTEFEIDLWEELDPDKKTFQFKVNTINKKYCQDAAISYSLMIDPSLIRFSLNEINPENCPGFNTATCSIPINEPTSRDYQFQIQLKEEITSEGVLRVRDGQYTIDMVEQKGFSLINKQLMRIPDNTIWGYVGFSEEAYQETAENFIKELELRSRDINFDTGYYGYFSINSEEKVEFDFEIVAPQLETFVFDFSEDESVLTTMLEEYRLTFGNALEIKLFNDKGLEL